MKTQPITTLRIISALFMLTVFTAINLHAPVAYAGGADKQSARPATAPAAGADAALPGKTTQAGRASVITTSPMPVVIRKVSVLIESAPSNSDIEVNGVYVGATPLQVSLKEGVHYVKISREGFLPWQRPVKAYNGLYLSATLVRESTTKHDVSLSATAK